MSDLKIRYAAYAPDGPRLGLLPNPLAASTADVMNDLGSGTLDYLADAPMSGLLESLCEIAVEIHNGTAWVEPGQRLLRLKRSASVIDETRTRRFSLPSYGMMLAKMRMLREELLDDDGARSFSGITVGTFLKTLIDESKARSNVPGLTYSFTTTTDSAGVPWGTTMAPRALRWGDDMLTQMRALADEGVIDWCIVGRQLRVFKAEGLGAVKNVTLGPNDVMEAPDEEDGTEMAGRIGVIGDNGRFYEAIAPSIGPWGLWEELITASGVQDIGALQLIGQVEQERRSAPRVQMTRQLQLAQTSYLPHVHYSIGDTIKAANDAGVLAPLRVRQITLTLDRNGTGGNLVLNDRFLERDIRQARTVKGMMGSASGSAGSGAIPSTDDKRKPKVPAGLVVSSAHAFTPAGAPFAIADVRYVAVTQGVDNSPIGVSKHELYARANVAGETWRKLTDVGGADGRIVHSPLPVAVEWQFKVRAVSAANVPGDFTAPFTVMLAEDKTPPPVPSKPLLSTALGILTIVADGKSETGGPMPVDFDRFIVWAVGPGAGRIVGELRGTGGWDSLPLAGLPAGTIVDVWFVAVDTSGNESGPSEVASLKVIGPPAAPTGLVAAENVGEWDAAGVARARLLMSWATVTKDEHGSAVPVDLYELWMRREGETAAPIRSSEVTLAALLKQEPGLSLWFSVRARGVDDRWSVLSPEVPVTTAIPSGVLAAPTKPIVTQSRGAITAAWDGALVSGAPDPRFRSVRLVMSSSVDGPLVPVGSSMSQASSQPIVGVPKDSERWFRWIAVDSRGVESAPSEAASIAITGIGFDDLDPSLEAAVGEAVTGTSDEWATSTSPTVAPSTGWSTTPPAWTATNYIWQRTRVTFGDGTVSVSSPVVLTGNPGTDGTPGTPGKGVSSSIITYQASASGTTAPTGPWVDSVPAVPAGQYLWSRTVTTFTDSTTTTAYAVGRMGVDGSNGTPGAPGGNGQTSYLHVAYATNATGTTGFSTTDPSGRSYMGTYTDFTEADSSNPALYAWSLIKGADGSPGGTGAPGKGISTSVVTYQGSASGTVTPTGAWVSTVPVVAAGSFLWTRTVLTFTDAAVTTTYSVARMGIDGGNGAPGTPGASVSEVRRYYQLVASAPAKPTANPAPAPWSLTEPAYTGVTGLSLFLVDLVILSTGSWTYSAVSRSASFDAANFAMAAANGKNKTIHSTSAASGTTGYVAGDVWFRKSGALIIGQWEFTTVWEARQVDGLVLANLDAGSITVGTLLAERFGANTIDGHVIRAGAIDGKVVTGALIQSDAEPNRGGKFSNNGLVGYSAEGSETTRIDFLTGKLSAQDVDISGRITGSEMFGGYIEAPVIASSAALGTGANVLNDPNFTSTVNTVWVASGHLGDGAAPTQTDTITWDQTWTSDGLSKRNHGNLVVDTKLAKLARVTGSVTLDNFGILPTAPRSFSNPYTFVNNGANQDGGELDPTPRAVVMVAPSQVARTTYLTNTAVAQFVAGEPWNLRLAHSALGDAQQDVSAWVEIIDATTSAVLWSRALTAEEKRYGTPISAMVTPTATQAVKVRLKATYAAAGAGVTRVARSGYALRPGSFLEVPNASGYHVASGATTPAISLAKDFSLLPFSQVASTKTMRRLASIHWRATSMQLSQITPEKGWSLDPANGLRLFDMNGAQTGAINGENNFLAGTFATNPTGQRVEINGQTVTWYDASNQKLRELSATPEGTGWMDFVAAGWTQQIQAQFRIVNGIVFGRGYISNSSFTGGFTTIGNLPAGIPGPADSYASFNAAANTGSAIRFRILPTGAVQAYANGASGSWFALTEIAYPAN